MQKTLRAAFISVLLLEGARALGNPVGGAVAGGNGNARIRGQGTPILTIDQARDRVIINWQNFSIGRGEVTRFVQPSPTAEALNRVISGNPSLIYGSLQANGRVFVINPNGILVGPSGVIDTKGFVASTLDIPDNQFMSRGPRLFTGDSRATVRNEGAIRALGGDVILMADRVENAGTIQAPQGTVGLAAGSQIRLVQSGNERLSVLAGHSEGEASGTGVDNSGTITAASSELKAAGGNIYALAINNGGVVRANTVVHEGGHVYLRSSGGNIQNSGTLSANGSQGRGGSIVVAGGHNASAPATVINSGTIEARGFGAGGNGGSVRMTGDQVGLFGSATVNVSGDAGGGTALIGGGFRGANPAIQNASATFVSPQASIHADAVNSGNGGRVVVWSDDRTRFYGSVSARGGAASGDGGLVEVSGHSFLDYQGVTLTLAPRGQAGVLLLDPTDLTIDNVADNNITGNGSLATPFAPVQGPGISELTWATIRTALGGGNVLVTTVGSPNTGGENGDIFVTANSPDLTSSHQLTLQAERALSIAGDILNSGGGGLVLEAQGAIGGVAISQTAGTINLSALTVLAPSGSVTLNQANNFASLTIGSAGGPIQITDAANLDVRGIAAGTRTVTLTANGASRTLDQSVGIITAGTLNLNGWAATTLNQANAVGALSVTAGSGAVRFTDAANLDVRGIDAGINTVTLTASGANRTLGESAGVITAPILNLSGWAATTLNQANAVGTLSVAGGTGPVQFTDILTLALNGISAPGQTVTLTANPAGSALTQSGVIDAGVLNLTGWGSTTLNLLNTVGALSIASGSGSILFRNAANLDLRGINAAAPTVGLIASGANRTLTESAGTINVANLTLSGWSATTLNQVNTVGVLSLAAGAGPVQFTDAANLNVLGIDAAGQSVTLTANGANRTLSQAGSINAGTLTLSGWTATTLNLANTVDALSILNGGGTVQFTDAANLDLRGIAASGQTVTLTAGGANFTLGQSTGIINAGLLSLNGWAATTLNQANTVAALSVAGANGPIQFTDAASLDLRGIAANGQTVTLIANGANRTLGQSVGNINAAALSLNGWAATTLNQANAVPVLSVANSSGAVSFTDTINLDVQGVNAAGNPVTLTANGAGLALSESAGVINASTLNLAGWANTSLEQNNVVSQLTFLGMSGDFLFTDAANLVVPALNFPGGLVRLTAGTGGPFTLGQSGVITANTLALNNWGAATLNQANAVGVLTIANAAGPVQFTDTVNLDLRGIGAAGRVVTLTANGAGLTLGESTGLINAGTLNLSGWGATTLNQANTVDALSISGGTGPVQFTDAANLDLRGIAAPGQNITLLASGTARTLGESAGIINASTLILNGWSGTTLNQANTVDALSILNGSGAVQFTDAANLDLQGLDAPGQTVTLTASGVNRTLGQSTGIINAGALSLNGWAATTLNQANTVGAFSVLNAGGPVQFTDASDLDVRGINAPGQTVTLASVGPAHALTESAGSINAANLTLIGWGDIVLDQNNVVPQFTVLGVSGDFLFTDAANLVLPALNFPGHLVRITAGAGGPFTLDQSGAIVAGVLSLNGWGTTTLNLPNFVNALTVANGVGSVVFNNAINLDLRGLDAAGRTVTLSAVGPLLNLGESTGIINVGTLNLNGWGATTLNQANTVAALSVVGGFGPVQFTDAVNLDLRGIAAPGQSVTLSGSGAPTLGESSGVINAAALSLNGWGATALNQANTVNSLSVNGAGGTVQFTDALNLDLGAISAAGQIITLTASPAGSTLTQSGLIQASQLNLINWGNTTLNSLNTVGALSVVNGSGLVVFRDVSTLDLRGVDASGQNVFLNGAGQNLTESSGSITAAGLFLNGWANTILNQPANNVVALGIGGGTGPVQFTDSANLDLQGIDAVGQPVTLTAIGAGRTLGQSFSINAGALTLDGWAATTLNQANSVAALSVLNGSGPVDFTDTVNLDIRGINAPGQGVTLRANVANLALTESSGVINAAALNLFGWGDVTLDQNNVVPQLTLVGTTGDFLFTDAANFVMPGINVPGHLVRLTAGVGGPFTLAQAGSITAGTLSLNGWGATTLNVPNAVDVLTIANALGPVQFAASSPLDLRGIQAPGQDVTLTAAGIGLALSESAGIITASTLTLSGWGPTILDQANAVNRLSIAGAAGLVRFTDASDLILQGIDAAGQTFTLTASGPNHTLGQSAAVNAAELDLIGWGATTLNGANTLGGFSVAGGTGPIQFTDNTDLDVRGISAAGQNITLNGGSLNRNLTETVGSINAAALTLSGWGTTTLDHANVVPVLTIANATGPVRFTDAANLELAGIGALGQPVTFTAVGGVWNLTESAAINADVLNLSGWGPTTLTLANSLNALSILNAQGAVQFGNSVNLDLRGIDAGGQTVDLTASAAGLTLGESAGIINASALNLNSWGQTVLNQANTVRALSILNGSGLVQFRNEADLDVRGLSVAGQSVTLSADNGSALSQSGVINADALHLSGWGPVTLSLANTVNGLSINLGQGDVRFSDAINLDLRGIAVGNHAVTLDAGAANLTLGQSGGIVSAGLLTLNNWASITLNQLNSVSALAVAGARGPVQFRDASTLDVRGLDAPNQPVTLTSTGAGFALNQSQGTINASALTLDGWGAVTLDHNNTVGVLSVLNGGGPVQFRDMISLNLADVRAPGQAVSLSAAGANLTLAQPGGFIINAGSLTLNNWGATTLNNANLVGALTVLGANGPLQFNNVANLTLHDVQASSQTVKVTLSGFDDLLTVAIGAQVSGSQVELVADRMQLGGSVSSASYVLLHPQTDRRGITLGGTEPGTLSLSSSDLNNVHAVALRIGNSTSGDINIKGEVAPSGTDTLSLQTHGSIYQQSGARITEDNLAVDAGSSISLTQPNRVGTLAAHAGGNISFNDEYALTAGSVDLTGPFSGAPESLRGVISTHGDVTLTANTINIAAISGSPLTIDVTRNHNVTLQPVTPGRGITVGSTKDPLALSLTQAELNRVQANVFQIGNPTAGAITGADIAEKPNTVTKLVLVGFGANTEVLAGQIASLGILSTATVPLPKLATENFSAAEVSAEQAGRLLPPGSIGVLFAQVPFPPADDFHYKLEDISKWTTGPVATAGTAGPQAPK